MRHLITSALPYANGPIHIGHLVEYVQTDMWARFMRLIGEDVIYMCADDTHGTPIELNARRQGITPEELIARSYEEHTRDFKGFRVEFDHFYTTNSPENKELAERVYLALKAGGHITRKTSEQFYSESLGRFLPDRMVKGTCPVCGLTNQNGDSCDNGHTYEPKDLIDPIDAIEGKTPVMKETEGLYVQLSDFADFLVDWMKDGVPQEAVRNFVQTWLDGGLDDWAISRDAPYFGFEIPGEPGKYFYVWLDAPIGYIAATKNYCDNNGLDWMDYWAPDADATVTHVIGKDIVYFHTLFWPAMLKSAGFKVPNRVQVHGFLTVNGAKMSKSKGTFIKAETYLNHLDPDYLRFYYATKLSPGIDDLDLNFDDFVARVNSDLVNNVVNLCSRVTKFIGKRFGGEVLEIPVDHELVERLVAEVPALHGFYEDWDFRGGMRRVAELGDAVNQFFQAAEPWKMIKEDEKAAQEVCSIALFGATYLMTVLSPIVPGVAAKLADALGVDSLTWSLLDPVNMPTKVTAPDTLIERIDPKAIDAIIEETRQLNEAANAWQAGPDDVVEVESFNDPIEFDDFARIDLRVGVVEAAKEVEGANKLLQLTVHCGKRINVFAGVRKAYADPAQLVGKRVVVVANLKPRKMRFGVSEGMLLAMSGDKDEGLQLAVLSDDAKGGWSVR